jgi:uncharacterized protein YecT (DUF1311 family)
MRLVPTAFVLLVFMPMQAHALDCGKAKSKVETAICADAALRATDDAMSKAYAEVRASSAEKERKALAQSQRKWIKGRDNQCGYLDRVALAKCVHDTTDARRRLLLGEAESGPGAPSRIIPVFIQKEATAHTYDVDFTLLKFAEAKTGGEKVFNAEIDKIAALAPLRDREDHVPAGGQLAAVTTMSLAYASPRLLSAKADSWRYAGGAHGNSEVTSINVDLEQGRIIKVGDIFEESAMPALQADCEKQIGEQKTEKMGSAFNPADDPNYAASTISEYLAMMSNWTFTAPAATVTFDPYAIGSYAEGPYACEFPISSLRTLAKPGAPLPE